MLNITPLIPDPWLSMGLLKKIEFVESEARRKGLDRPAGFMSHILVTEIEALAISKGWKSPPDYRDVLLSNLKLKSAILRSGQFSESIAHGFIQDLHEYSKL